ncbi:glycosyltransferase [Candidatus Kaiserbacteria bacterium]|nr:glycosyltransferase [Candidatus Kaiserbacteria bacterium]
MIVELFGLPGSGKTTLAKSFAEEGAIAVPAADRAGVINENILFILRHPFRALRLFSFILVHASTQYRFLLLANLFFAANAKYMRAHRVSKRGQIAVIDQGHFQTFLSLFDGAPHDSVLKELMHIVLKPDVLLILDVSKGERDRRTTERGRPLRPAAGEAVFPRALKLFKTEAIAHRVIPGVESTKLMPLIASQLSYVTMARMPTEKAHGVSIAHMCHEFAREGADTALILLERRNLIAEDIYTYYGVPHDFHVISVRSADLLGRGYTRAFFFFLQRIAFLFALSRVRIPWGTVYTREPEIAWLFSGTHRVIFEAHRWPKGLAGVLTARLLRGAALVVCNSRGTEEVAKHAGVRRTLVAPNGFDPEQFKSAPKRRTAAKTLGPKGLSVGIIGTGKKQISPPLYELGRIPQPGIPAFLMTADMLILPNIREGESEHFTSPIKLFEYLAAGKAIIASDLPSIREILKDGDAVFVSPGDADALAEAVSTLAKDAPRREKLAARAKALSVSYTWTARAKRILETLSTPPRA